MKQIYLIAIMLVWSLSASSQELSESVYWEKEIEDSLNSFAIKSVEHPEELLMQALVRLEKDLQYKHSKREYHLETIFNPWAPSTLSIGDFITAKSQTNTSPIPLTASRDFTVEGDDGIDVMNYKLVVKGPLSVELPYYVPITLQDSTDIEWQIDISSYENEMHVEVNGSKYKWMQIYDLFNYYTLEKVYKSIMKVYDVTAYSIGDDSGRGVYRIQLDEKKRQRTREEQLFFENRKMKWYLDRQSLRLTQVNGVRHDDENLSIYRNDFGEENGAPVLTKATKISYFDNRIMKTTIRLIDK